MKKLFFIAMMILYAPLTFTSATIAYRGNNSTSFGSYKSNNYEPRSQLKTLKTTTTSSNTTVYDDNFNQQIALLILSSLEPQQKQTSQPRHQYDDSYLKADAATIEKWKLRGKTATKSTTQAQTAVSEASAQSEAKVTPCMALLVALAACIGENEAFWRLRDVYVDSGCEEPADEIQDLPENVCYSIPLGATGAAYGLSYGAPLAGSAIGSALLAAAPPLMMCAVVYTGSKFIVTLIQNYKNKHETPEFKLARDAAENYATNLESALNRTLNIGSVNAIPINPLYYAMSYGYENDPYARVITIVDKQQKQHIFVVPDDVNTWPFQISNGSMDPYSLIHPRYLVPQSTIDAVLAKQQAQEQKAQEVKNKAMQEKTKAILDKAEKNLDASMKSIAHNKIPSNEHLLPDNFKAAYSKNGIILRDKMGAYIDVNGQSWNLDVKEQRWNVTNSFNSNKSVVGVKSQNPSSNSASSSPSNATSSSATANNASTPPQATKPSEMSAPEFKAPEQKGCEQIDPESNKPKIFTSPMPEPQKPSNEGCGKPVEVEKRTDTAHTPDPELDKVGDQSLPGCGGMDPASKRPDLFNAQQNREDLLPQSGDVPFEPKKQKGGKVLRDKQGGYIDKHDNAWNWDPIKEEWDVVGKKGHRNVNSKGTETHKGTHPDAKSGTSNSQKNK